MMRDSDAKSICTPLSSTRLMPFVHTYGPVFNLFGHFVSGAINACPCSPIRHSPRTEMSRPSIEASFERASHTVRISPDHAEGFRTKAYTKVARHRFQVEIFIELLIETLVKDKICVTFACSGSGTVTIPLDLGTPGSEQEVECMSKLVEERHGPIDVLII